MAEMVETAVSVNGDENMPLLVTPLAQSSKEYLDWVKEQTMEVDQSEAHYDDDPFANHKPVSEERVAGMKDFQK